MTLNIKYFNVLNSITGLMKITGRYTSSQVNNILTHNVAINNTIEQTEVNGAPTSINSGGLYNKAHFSSSYIEINRNIGNNTNTESVFISDAIMRLTYLGGTTSASNSLIYGFAPSSNTSITNITWVVIIAKNTSHTIGDYFDIELPNSTSYPKLYISFILLNTAFDNKINIVNDTYSITNINTPNFCIDPSKSLYDTNQSHFIILKGKNNMYGFNSHITICCEDWHMASTDKDYNDFIFSISSKYISDIFINDNSSSLFLLKYINKTIHYLCCLCLLIV